MIPSGLQALMEASAVLQQQASQTAPGPQGQQPTVASQVMQQAQQAAQPAQMPQMQDIGRQAGIAGQLMAQRQQQQQQMAQDPQAVAQMAAQMLKQQGVAGLPTNMQFKEGGIIGYAGPQGSVVANPVADRELAEIEDVEERLGDAKRRRIREERERLAAMRAPYARAFGMTPTELEDLEYGLRMAENEYERAGPSEAAAARAAVQETLNRERARRSGQVRGGERPTDPASLAAIPRETGRLAGDVARPFVTAGRNLAGDVAGAGRMIAESVRESPVGQAAGAAFSRGMDQEGIQSLLQGRRKPEFEPVLTSLPEDRREEEALKNMPAADRTPPADTGRPAAPQQAAGIAALAAPRAAMPQPRGIRDILASMPEDEQAKADIERIQKIGRETLEARRAMPDLEQQEIDARNRARAQREQLLKSQRERDTFTRFNALFRDLRTWGNEYGAVDRAIDEREKAAIDADLLHEQSVVKLRQAQQARQLGNMDAEAGLIKQGMDLRNAERQRRLEMAKIDAEVEKVKLQGEQREATSYADRLSNLQLKLADLAQREAVRKDERLNQQYTAAAGQLSRAQAAMEKAIKDRFGSYLTMRNVPGSKPDPKQEKDLRDYVDSLTVKMITPLERQVDELASKVLGTTPTAASTGKTLKFDASGNLIK
jgi:hypothetical protein